MPRAAPSGRKLRLNCSLRISEHKNTPQLERQGRAVWGLLSGLYAAGAGHFHGAAALGASGGVPGLRAELPGDFQHEQQGVLVLVVNEGLDMFGQAVGQGHGPELLAVLRAELLEPFGIRVRHAA